MKVWVEREVLCLMRRAVPSGLEQHASEIQRSVPKTTCVFDQATNSFTEVSSYLKSFTTAPSPFAANDSFCPMTMPLTNGKEYCIIHFWSRTRNFQLATCGGTRQGYLAWEPTAGYRISRCHGRNRSWAQRLPSELPVFLRLGTNTVLLVKLETPARKT